VQLRRRGASNATRRRRKKKKHGPELLYSEINFLIFAGILKKLKLNFSLLTKKIPSKTQTTLNRHFSVFSLLLLLLSFFLSLSMFLVFKQNEKGARVNLQ